VNGGAYARDRGLSRDTATPEREAVTLLETCPAEIDFDGWK